ncbi:MAG: 16S rRNA (guanine(966)-N(2))-methyltransferase RsmD [Clostridiales bacterium]|nr:16S rRNA (guanine(966)-N(2))-methyltransferase RsmD [Clostridiales bacterium]
MRVIAGSARRTNLKTLPGLDTRPTTDKIKETLFNMLPFDLSGYTFLDLFAGSGGIGIEALSRGADKAVFVDKNRRAAEIIRSNLRATHLEERADVLVCDAATAIARLDGTAYFDYIFIDPPYRHELERRVLEQLRDTSLIDKQSTLIVEASLDTDFGYLGALGYVTEKQKIYKTNQHLFLYQKEKR